MRIGLTGFRLLLGLGWGALVAVSVHALDMLGAEAAVSVFFGDFGHPWRALYNSDLGVHLLLAAAWMVLRARSLPAGLTCAAMELFWGGLFTLPYLLVVSFQEKGNLRRILLGARETGGPVQGLIPAGGTARNDASHS